MSRYLITDPFNDKHDKSFEEWDSVRNWFIIIMENLFGWNKLRIDLHRSVIVSKLVE